MSGRKLIINVHLLQSIFWQQFSLRHLIDYLSTVVVPLSCTQLAQDCLRSVDVKVFCSAPPYWQSTGMAYNLAWKIGICNGRKPLCDSLWLSVVFS